MTEVEMRELIAQQQQQLEENKKYYRGLNKKTILK